MKKYIDLDTWNRREHFDFFRTFTEPFFGVCITVDCEKAYQTAKTEGVSFFAYYLHKSVVAANLVEAFRYRIEEDKVWICDAIDASCTINRPDGTFGFSWINYDADFAVFSENVDAEIARVRTQTGLKGATTTGESVIHYSVLPWLHFTGLSHARHYGFADSVPKISFGKMVNFQMPVSIHVHHALADGYDVGRFVEIFQKLLNNELV